MDRQAVEAEQALDGKYLLRTSDPSLSAEDVALGYKQLAEVERGWRDFKLELDLRPVYHRKRERIQAHVQLCWLALLLIRVSELKSSRTWRRLRQELEQLHLGSFRGPDGVCWKRTTLSGAQQAILSALEIPEPPLFLRLQTSPSTKAEEGPVTSSSRRSGPRRRRRSRPSPEQGGETLPLPLEPPQPGDLAAPHVLDERSGEER